MNCDEFRDARMLAACGEPAGREFENHRAVCSDCREEIEEIRSVRGAYALTRDEAMPAPLRARLERPARSRWTWAAAAALLAAFGLWIALRPAPPAPLPPVVQATPPAPDWQVVDRGISNELSKLDTEIGWHELVLKR